MAEAFTLNPGAVPLDWHEAVALVQEIAARCRAGSPSVPSLEAIAIDARGQLLVLDGGGRHAAAPTSESQAVLELLRLLRQLLGSTPSPPALLRLSQGNREDGSRIDTLDGFVQSLAFFERPERERDLRALTQRLSEARETERVSAELDALTRKTREQEIATPSPRGHVATPLEQRVLTAALAGIVVLALVLLGLVLGTSGQRAPVIETVARAADTEPALERDADLPPQPVASSGRQPGQSLRKPVAPAAAQRRATAPNEPVRTRPAPSRSGKAEAFDLAWRPLPSEPGANPRKAKNPAVYRESIEVASTPAFLLNPPSADDGDDTVYDSRHREVTPALLVRRQLPVDPSGRVPAGTRGVLDVVVSRAGRVEQVRLMATTVERRYYDTMILAAVKAWQFQPALKDGKPVRYRLEIPIVQ